MNLLFHILHKLNPDPLRGNGTSTNTYEVALKQGDGFQSPFGEIVLQLQLLQLLFH